MHAHADGDESGIRAAFLVDLLQDRELGRELGVEHYQARYPGYEAVVAREYAELVSGDEGDPATGPDSPSADVGARYRIDGEVGRGGMGIVMKAYEGQLCRHLALKRLRAGAHPHELRRFLEEARVTAQLHHPGVVPVHELGIDGSGRPYFTMDLVRGRTFASMIDGLSPADGAWTRAIEVLTRVCEAVAFAHSKGVVHRDLKPDNVMVGQFGEVYVMDWGLAHVAGAAAAGDGPTTDEPVVSARQAEAAPEWTLQGDVLGTPAYMAPEQARGEVAVDPRVDVYAIGAMLYQLLAGRRPYADVAHATTSHEVLTLVREQPPQHLAALRPDAPPELVAICEKAMARVPADRYAGVLQLRDDLRAFVERRVVEAYEHGAWAELRKWVSRNRLVAASVALAVVALTAGLAVSAVQRARATMSAALANDSFGDAVDAVEQMLTRVGQHKLDNVPQATAVRREVLQDAVDFYEKLLRKRSDDPTLRRRAANASYRAAALHEQLGDRDAARAANRRALQLRLAELERTPDDRELRREIVGTHMQAGLQAENIGDFDAATNAYREAIAVADALLAERREEDALALAGHLQCNLGVLAWRQQQAEAARTHAEAALTLLAEVRGAASDAIVQRAVAHNLLGVLARDAKDPAGSLQHFRRTAALYERLAAAAPDDYDTRKGLAMALQNVAIAENDGRDFGAAVTTIERALELRRRNVDDFGDVPDCWAGLGAGLTNRAAFLRGLGRHEDSLRSAGEALAAIRTALARDDERAKFAHSLLLAHRAFHSAAVALGRHADVAANARAMAAAPQGDVSWALGAARRLVEASRLVRKDKQLDAARQAALAEEYAATAVATLVAVGERSALTTAELDDPGLRPLRERDDFRALRNKVQERTPR